jgi:hypothetical protein
MRRNINRNWRDESRNGRKRRKLKDWISWCRIWMFLGRNEVVWPAKDNNVDLEPVHLETISDGEDEDDGYLVDPDVMQDEDEGLQEKFVQAARNAHLNEDREFERWAKEVNRGGIWALKCNYILTIILDR